MNDIQLALVISRLYESEFEVSSTYKNILQKRILGYDCHERTFTLSQMHQDPFFRSMAYWILEDYSKALDTLLEQPVREEDDAGPTGKLDNKHGFACFYLFIYLLSPTGDK